MRIFLRLDMRFLIFFCLIFVVCAFPVFAGEKADSVGKKQNFIDVEKVSFIESHDPGWLILKNDVGQKYIGDFYYNFIKFDDIETWTAGEKFIVRITDNEGAGVVREKTHKFYKLFFREERHPIDVQLSKCKKFIDDCYIEASNQWLNEADFAFHHYLNSLKNEQQKKKFIRAQEDWDTYAASTLDSYREISPYEGGTMNATMAAQLPMILEKSRFYHIVYFYE